MKLHNPFRVAVDEEDFPLFLCAVIVKVLLIAAGIISAAYAVGQIFTPIQFVLFLLGCVVGRTIYAVFKGK